MSFMDEIMKPLPQEYLDARQREQIDKILSFNKPISVGVEQPTDSTNKYIASAIAGIAAPILLGKIIDASPLVKFLSVPLGIFGGATLYDYLNSNNSQFKQAIPMIEKGMLR